jgi:hypothetical protein
MEIFLKKAWFILLLTAGLLVSCTRPASKPAVVYATDSAPRVMIDKVQVNQGEGIYVSGRSTIPNGECVKTELLANTQSVDWWPRDICIAVDGGRWEILAGLGRSGAPERLDPSTAYELRAWWPKKQAETLTRFPFDIKAP